MYLLLVQNSCNSIEKTDMELLEDLQDIAAVTEV